MSILDLEWGPSRESGVLPLKLGCSAGGSRAQWSLEPRILALKLTKIRDLERVISPLCALVSPTVERD